MPTYVFKGRNRANEIVTGERAAENREALDKILKREQIILTSVREKGKEFALPKFGKSQTVNAKDQRAAGAQRTQQEGAASHFPSLPAAV